MVDSTKEQAVPTNDSVPREPVVGTPEQGDIADNKGEDGTSSSHSGNQSPDVEKQAPEVPKEDAKYERPRYKVILIMVSLMVRELLHLTSLCANWIDGRFPCCLGYNYHYHRIT